MCLNQDQLKMREKFDKQQLLETWHLYVRAEGLSITEFARCLEKAGPSAVSFSPLSAPPQKKDAAFVPTANPISDKLSVLYKFLK